MPRFSVPVETLNHPEVELLPVEEMQSVGGIDKMVNCEYIAQITSAKEAKAKKDSSDYLVATSAIERPSGEVIYIDDYMTYKKPGVQRVADLLKILDIPFDTAGPDDLLGRFVWVTIKHDVFTPEGKGSEEERKSNKINKYVRACTKEELVKAGLAPF